MRRAQEADFPRIRAHLERHIESSMFPLMNLRDHGLDGDHDYAMRFWLTEDGVLGLTMNGMVMPQLGTDWEGIPGLVNELDLAGALGETGQVKRLMAQTKLAHGPFQMMDHEPHMVLDMADMVLPECGGMRLEVLSEAHRDFALPWREAYNVELINDPPSQAKENALIDFENYVKRGSHRVLFDGDTPVSMTGFNAQLPQVVQIGGVYTPPEHRNRGYARKAVALHLQERVAPKAVLFAGSEMAQRAYAGIGFRLIGEFSVVLLAGENT